MAIKIFKSNTAGRRKASVIDYRKVLTPKRPEKTLIFGKKRISGRSKGRLTIRHRGGGTGKNYRIVDFKQNKFNVPATVKAIEYDPNRSAFLALIFFQDGTKSYILAPHNLKVGDKIVYNPSAKAKPGNRMMMKNIPPGMAIHNIEMVPGRGGQLVRSAGGHATIMSFDKGFALVRMPSSELRLIPEISFASIGDLSNPDHSNIRIGKAGRVRLAGRRPVVRGKVMSPAAHPHGGGEGRNPVGLIHPKTKLGKPAKGVKTRSRKASDKFIVRRRLKKKKKR